MTEKQKSILVTIWVAAFLLNLFLLFLYYHGPGLRVPVGDEPSYIGQAHAIASGKIVSRGPLWPPGYGFFLAVPFFVSNALDCSFPAPLLFAQLVQIALWAACGLLFTSIVWETLSSCHARLLAVGLFLLYPTSMAFSHYFWPEIAHLVFYLAALWIIVKKPLSLNWSVLLGTSLAAATLMKLVYLPVSPILACFPIVRGFRAPDRWAPALLAPLVFFILLAPVSYLNYRTYGKFMIADSSVFNVWVGLTDRELTDWHPNRTVGLEMSKYLRSAPTHSDRNKLYLNRIRDLIRTQGLIPTLASQISKQYYRLFDHRTFFTKQLPGGMRVRYPLQNRFLATVLRFINGLVWAAVLAGLGVGLVVTLSEVRSVSSLAWIHLFVLFIVYNITLFLFLHVMTRYVIAFFPMLCVVSARGWEASVCRLGQRYRAPNGCPSWGVLVAGALVSLLFLHLGFREVSIQ